MKFVAVTYGEPPNPSFGASTRVYYSYLFSIIENGFDLTLLQLGENSVESRKKIAELGISLFPAKVVLVPHAETVAISRLGVRMSQLSKDLHRIISSEEPDYIISFDIEAAVATRGIRNSKKIVWLGDLRFQTTWYHFTLLPKNWMHKILSFFSTLLRCISWITIYRSCLKSVNKVVVSSHSSVRNLNLYGVCSSYMPYPWPVELNLFSRQISERPTFLFFGNLVGLGSLSAFKSVYGEIYDECLGIWGEGNFEILISGLNEIRSDIEMEIYQRPSITYLGYVPDLSDLLSRVHAILVPIMVPVGNRSRVLTALAHGVPVIGHRNLRFGNPALSDRKNCLLYETKDELRKALELSVIDKPLVEEILEHGSKLYLAENEPKIACEKFLSEVFKQ